MEQLVDGKKLEQLRVVEKFGQLCDRRRLNQLAGGGGKLEQLGLGKFLEEFQGFVAGKLKQLCFQEGMGWLHCNGETDRLGLWLRVTLATLWENWFSTAAELAGVLQL